MADTIKYVQGQDYFLSGSGVTATAVTLTLASMQYPDGSNIATADLGTVCQAVFEPETSREENFSFTTITQNANGTATLTGITRGLAFKAPYTQDVALEKAHAGGTKVRISNTAPFYDKFAAKGNDETITGVFTYSTTPIISNVPTVPTEAANKGYVDGVAIAGAPDMNLVTKGIAEEATTAEINADTQTGATGAELAVNPFYLSTSKYVQQSGANLYGASAAGTDTYAITLSPAIAAYADGQTFRFKADVGNTGAATLNVNGLGAVAITKNNDVALETNDIETNQIVEVTYNSTGPTFQMQSQSGIAPSDQFIPKSVLVAKGDIVTATAAATPAVLTVGANGTILQADSTAATGQSWKERFYGTSFTIASFIYSAFFFIVV